jgi:hypothetical protein
MENEEIVKDTTELDRMKPLIHNTNDIKGMLMLLIVLTLIAIAAVLFFLLRPEQVLVLEYRSGADASVTQLVNAIRRGGMAYFNSDTIESAHREYASYGAVDNNGMYLVIPAYLNFVASKGWRLQSVNIGGGYYFTRKKPIW